MNIGVGPIAAGVSSVLQEKRQDAIDQLKAACLVLADMLKAKGYAPECYYMVGNDRSLLRVGDNGPVYQFFYSSTAFEEAVVWVGALPEPYTSENCAAWFQPEAVST